MSTTAGRTGPEVLAAAERAFASHGYAGATLQRIASEAGLSRVTLHRRGVTKEGLLAELVARATEDYRKSIWPSLTDSGPASGRIESALTALCESAERNMALLVALRSQSDGIFHRPSNGFGGSLTRNVFTEPIERILRDGAADGSLRKVADPVETATVLFNQVGWTYVELRSGHGWSPERSRAAVLDSALLGVLARN